MKKNIVLVTGGAGFIGSHLIEELLKTSHVICVDNYTLGSENNIKKFFTNSNFEFFNIDIANTSEFISKLENKNIDIIYHLAANSDIQKGGQNPEIDYHDTFETTFSVLELMRKSNIKNLFFSSTSAVYGNITDTSLKEDIGNLSPISYYGASKLGSEAFVSAFSYMNDFNTIIFRFPNVIGPNLTHGVIFDFIKKLKNNPNELEILGDGTQCKPYIYISDLIDAILLLTQNISKGVEIYNLGVATATTVTNIANIVCKELGLKNVKYLYTGGNVGWKGDVPKFQYDLSKIHQTGWTAKYTSDEAVIETVRKQK